MEINREKINIKLGGLENSSASKGIRHLNLKQDDEIYKIEIYVDLSSIEIFLRNYKDSISLFAFTNGNDYSLVSNEDTNLIILKHDMI